ncbi:MAG: TRAP transporter substrate-binding protein [Acidimicrobiia bacterium]
MTTSIRIGGYSPEDSSHSRAVAHFRDQVAHQLGEEVAVDVMWNILDEGRPAPDLLNMVEAGELTLCYFSTSYLGTRVPELNVLEVPFLFDSLPAAHAALDGPLGDALTAATESRTGLAVLGYWDNGFRHLTNRLRPVRTPEDCAGMSVRLQPNRYHEAMIESWGGRAVPVELKTGISLIAAGEVDAQENPLANTVAYGVDKVHRHVTMTGHLYGARGLYADPAQVDIWPKDVRAVVFEAVRSAIRFQRSLAAATELELRDRLESEGVQFEDLTVAERSLFGEAAAEVEARAHEELDARLFSLLGR